MNLLRSVRDFLNNNPLGVIALLMAIRDFFIGIGFWLGIGGARGTLLWRNFEDIPWEASGEITGIVFMICGILMLIGLLTGRKFLVRHSLYVSAFMWFFAAVMYVLFSEWILAIYLAGFMAIASRYVAFSLK